MGIANEVSKQELTEALSFRPFELALEPWSLLLRPIGLLVVLLISAIALRRLLSNPIFSMLSETWSMLAERHLRGGCRHCQLRC